MQIKYYCNNITSYKNSTELINLVAAMLSKVSNKQSQTDGELEGSYL